MDCAVSIIIPVFNQWALTCDCLHSLAEHTPGNVQAVVVDNGSSDATASELEPLGTTLFSDRFVRVRCDANVNFGPGCNLGARAASADLLFFLNNDTLLTPGWLPPLLEAAADPAIGALGPVCLYPGSERVQHLGVTFYVGLGAAHLHQFFPGSHPLVEKRRTLQTITGAALMIRADRFAACGGFYEEYVNGCEDIDLCCRLREQGYSCTVVPQSRIFHIASQSQGRFEQDKANSALYKRRCGHAVQPDYHIWAREEGFEVQLTAAGQVFMVRPDDVSHSFAARFAPGGVHAGDLAALWDFLDAEPLWEQGYELLAASLESVQMYAEAVSVRVLQHRFFPRLQHARKLLALGRAANRPDVAEAGEKSIRWHLEEAANTLKLRHIYTEHIAFFQAAGEETLERMFRAQLQALPAE